MTYCFDLDGTICSHEIDYSKAKPYQERVSKINDLYNQGHKIIIDTARGTTTKIDWLEITKQQLEDWGLKYHQLRVGQKFTADFYIDDKAVSDFDFFNDKPEINS